MTAGRSPSPLLVALAAAAGLALPAAPVAAQSFDRPTLPRIGPAPSTELPSIAPEPQRRRRHMPGGAATPFFTLPDGATPFTPQMGTSPLSIPQIPGAPAAPGTLPALPPQFADRTPVALDARFRQGGQYVREGLYWRVFADQPEANGAFALVANRAIRHRSSRFGPAPTSSTSPSAPSPRPGGSGSPANPIGTASC